MTSSMTHSLYIHWPFCPYKCHFCPFVAYAGHDHLMGQYHKVLVKEIQQYADQFAEPLTIKTIFFGGGTPSTYPDDLLLDMGGILNKAFRIENDNEISIEVNPGTVRPEQLPLWKQVGINRLSIGVQSLNDKVLHTLNRQQSAADVHRLIHTAQEHFDNMSIDLIIGLPGISTQEWKELIQQVVQWPISHISIYFLTVHEGTALYFRVKKNDITLPADEGVVDLYVWTVEYLAAHGFNQYEISNFGRNGYQSKHNSVYWARLPYKGFGVGACSFDGINRTQNTKNIFNYVTALERETKVYEFEERLSTEQVFLETLMLGLRQSQGISRGFIFDSAQPEHHERIATVMQDLEDNGYIKQRGECLVLTPLGLAVENEIIVRLSN